MIAQGTKKRRTWRRALGDALNRAARTFRVGNFWYWLPDEEAPRSVDIVSLVCPLRYDVLVRRDFFTLYAANRALYRADFDGFVALARQSSYHTWYMESEAVRCKRELLDDPAALEAGFVARIRRAATLYDSVEANGFDERYPVVLKTAERLLPPTADRLGPPTGKQVANQFFLADGCHRLALRLAQGHTRLTRGTFRVKCYRTFSPFDSTALLARSLPLDAERYFAFLSSRYGAPFTFTSAEALLAHVRARHPEQEAELLSVMRADGFGVEAALAQWGKGDTGPHRIAEWMTVAGALPETKEIL